MIEYLDAEEEECSMIAMFIHDLVGNPDAESQPMLPGLKRRFIAINEDFGSL